MTKEDLRQKIKSERLGMSPKEVRDKSQIIVQRLISTTQWGTVKSIYIYEPIARLNEVDATGLLAYLKNEHPKIKIEVAKKSAREVAPEQKFDWVIVPTLAFDKKLNRLGWGGGWYDKFLAAQPQAKKIGLCFEKNRVNEIPTEAHDISLDLVITELYNY